MMFSRATSSNQHAPAMIRILEVLALGAIACACCLLTAGALDWWAGMLGLSSIAALTLS